MPEYYTGAPYHYDKEHRLPFTVKNITRHGKTRRCVIQLHRMASGHVMDSGRVIAMSV